MAKKVSPLLTAKVAAMKAAEPKRTRSRASKAAGSSLPSSRTDAKSATLDKKTFMRSATIAGITVKGLTDAQVISAFQKKYHIPETGKLDAITEYKMKSVAASRGARVSFI